MTGSRKKKSGSHGHGLNAVWELLGEGRSTEVDSRRPLKDCGKRRQKQTKEIIKLPIQIIPRLGKPLISRRIKEAQRGRGRSEGVAALSEN